MESPDKHDVFELTDLPKGHETIGCRWVFNIKGDGRKKARLVAQGFLQVEGVNYNELFSPVVRFESMRLMLALAALHNWYMTGVDVCTAYLYGKLDEEIYMHQPEGFIARGQESKVIHLKSVRINDKKNLVELNCCFCFVICFVYILRYTLYFCLILLFLKSAK